MGALALVVQEADWSPWTPLTEAAQAAPQTPGVYLARGGLDGLLLYVGHAGERAASQPGLRGRLGVYARGKGAVSGLGEAALDRALADPAFVRQRLELLESGTPERAKDWARAALVWADVHVCWTPRHTKAEAIAREARLPTLLDEHDLWNRARPGRAGR